MVAAGDGMTLPVFSELPSMTRQRRPLEPVYDLQVPRAGSCLRAGRGRAREWTSVHNRVMAPAGATLYHLTATRPSREVLGDRKQALSHLQHVAVFASRGSGRRCGPARVMHGRRSRRSLGRGGRRSGYGSRQPCHMRRQSLVRNASSAGPSFCRPALACPPMF
jgi:hypothetical protein